jgi:thiol:disulfide interchange protein
MRWYEGALTPGAPATLGVVLMVRPGWHVQAGRDSGDEVAPYVATEVEVELPDGWTGAEPRWPPADTFRFGEGEFAEELRGYGGTFVVAVPVMVPLDAGGGALGVRARVVYQACDDSVCLAPETLVIEGVTAASVVDREIARLFERTLGREPARAPPAAGASRTVDVSGSKWWGSLAFVWAACLWMAWRTLRIARSPGAIVATGLAAVALMWGMLAFTRGMTAPPRLGWIGYDHATFEALREEGRTVLIDFTADWCPNCLVNERLLMADDEVVAALSSPDVAPMRVDFTGPDEEGRQRFDALGGGGIPVIGVYPASREEPIVIRGTLATTRPVLDALRGVGAAEDAGRVVFDLAGLRFTLGRQAVAVIVAFAFLAGFFMNFTPCVLPVIPLKILALQAHAKDPRRCLALGASFCLGILAVYAALGALVAGLVGGAESFGWGDQFQRWWLNALIGAVVGAMGFGMLGLFSIRLPQAAYVFHPQSDTHVGSFTMGAFTAVLSTPCTGPLLGGVLAWMVTQPPALGFATLVVMGAGMAAPYLLLTARPDWLARLPRTGPGSVLVKQVMGLLLMAVSVYFLGTAITAFGR